MMGILLLVALLCLFGFGGFKFLGKFVRLVNKYIVFTDGFGVGVGANYIILR
jgi:hypothetical protein